MVEHLSENYYLISGSIDAVYRGKGLIVDGKQCVIDGVKEPGWGVAFGNALIAAIEQGVVEKIIIEKLSNTLLVVAFSIKDGGLNVSPSHFDYAYGDGKRKGLLSMLNKGPDPIWKIWQDQILPAVS